MNTNVITIRLSSRCIESYRYLQSKNINPAKYLRIGGEQMVIDVAEKNNFVPIKIKDRYF